VGVQLPVGRIEAVDVDVPLHALVGPGHRAHVGGGGVHLPRVDGADVGDLGGVGQPLVDLGGGRLVAHKIVHAATGQRGRVLKLPPVLAVEGDRIGVVVPDRLLPAAGPGLEVDLAEHRGV